MSALQDERTKAREEVQTLKTELARRQEDFKHTQELQNLTIQEESAASSLSYERLLSDKRVVDIRLDEIEVRVHTCTTRNVQREYVVEVTQTVMQAGIFLLQDTWCPSQHASLMFASLEIPSRNLVRDQSVVTRTM